MKKNIVQWVFLIIIACLSLGIYQYPIYAQEHTQLQEEQQDNTAQKEIQPLKESQNILKEENQQINQQTNKQTNQQQDTTEVQEGSAQTENNPDVSNIENSIEPEAELVSISGIYYASEPHTEESVVTAGAVHQKSQNAGAIEFRWQYYNVGDGTWHVIQDWGTTEWVKWTLPQAGDYWLYVEGRLAGENYIRSKYVTPYEVKGAQISISGIYYAGKPQTMGDTVTAGAVHEISGGKASFRWQYYDLSNGSWHVIKDWNDSEWVQWTLPKTGAYWLYVEAKINGGLPSAKYAEGFAVKDKTISISGIYIPDNQPVAGKTITAGAVHVKNNSDTLFRWQYYRIKDRSWHVISDWSTSEWVRWELPECGSYWLYVEAKTTTGNTSSKVMGYKIALSKDSMRFIAHRGYSAMAPENTIPAFTLAGEAGFWGVETDVYETVDGVFVLSHDDSLKRMTGMDVKITEITYEELQKFTINAGSNANQYSNLKIPTLEEYLQICTDYGMVPVIEMKQLFSPESCKRLLQIIEQSGWGEACEVISFYRDDLTQMRDAGASMQMLLLTYAKFDEFEWLSQYRLGLDTYYTNVTEELIENLDALGLPFGAWTLDDKQKCESLYSIGLREITSNRVLFS